MMTSLMRSDWCKLQKSRSLKVCLLIAFVLGAVMALLYHMAWVNLGESLEATLSMMQMLGSSEQSIRQALEIIPQDDLWSYVNTALADTNVLYIAAIVIGVFVGSEYSMGTIKNSVSRGFSRNKVYASKLIFSVGVMLLTVLCYLLGTMIAAVSMFGFRSEGNASDIMLVLSAYLCEFIAVSSIYVWISFWLKSTGHSIAFSLVIPMLISSVLQVVSIVNNHTDAVSRFWIFQTVTSTRSLCLSGEAYVPFLSAAVYFAVSCFGGLMIFRHQELK